MPSPLSQGPGHRLGEASSGSLSHDLVMAPAPKDPHEEKRAPQASQERGTGKKKKKNQPTGEALPGVQNRRKSHVVSGRWATKEKDQSECL